MLRTLGPLVVGCLLVALLAAPTLADDGDTVQLPSLDRPAASNRAVHVVRHGDCLWTIARAQLAQRRLPVGAADVARHWPHWYARNRAVVGPDPDLIHPGQHLHAPHLVTGRAS